MRVVLGTARYWVPLMAGFLCFVGVGFVGPLVGWLLIFTGFGLILEGGTAMLARAARAGGMGSHRQ